jgi:hypothetical protein
MNPIRYIIEWVKEFFNDLTHSYSYDEHGNRLEEHE